MYIGNDLQIAHPSYKIIDDISSGFNGSATSFALQVSGETPVPFPISTQQVMISVNGVVQEPDPNGSAGFKLLGSNIVFSSAPANGHAFFGVINAGADYVTAGSEFPDGSATAPSFTFQDDQDTGWYRNASGDVGYSSNGTAILNFDGNGLTIAAGKGLTVDTSTLKVDATNNRVGIGSASPTETLHVYQNAADNVNALIENASQNHGNLIQFKQITTGSVTRTAYVGHGGDNTGQLKVKNSANIILESGNTTALTLDSSQDATFAGDVIVDDIQADRIMHRGDVNTTIRFPAADTFAVETAGSERLRVDSSGRLLVGLTSSVSNTAYLQLKGVNTSDISLYWPADSATGGSQINWRTDGGGTATELGRIYCAQVATGAAGGTMHFMTHNGTSVGERLRIDGSGRLLLGTTTEGDVGADDLTVASSGSTGITVRSGTSNYGSIYFSDGTSGADEYRGIVAYNHSDNSLRLSTNATTALTFNSSQNATFTGIGIFTKSSSDTDHTNNSLPAAESGLYTLNSNGTNGTFSSVGVIANNGTSDQSASFIAKCTSSGYSPEIYITQRNGANSQRNTIAINTLGDATFIGAITSSSGAISDHDGDLRNIPLAQKTSAYVLVAQDAGRAIHITTGGVTVNNSIFSAGNAVTIINDSGSDQTITQGSGVTIYNTADATTGNRTLAGRGMATIWFNSASKAYISGAGLS